MKDLFVELAELSSDLGVATLVAINLRVAMISAVSEEERLELRLHQRLMVLSDNARLLAERLKDKQVGIALSEEESPAGRSVDAAEEELAHLHT